MAKLEIKKKKTTKRNIYQKLTNIYNFNKSDENIITALVLYQTISHLKESDLTINSLYTCSDNTYHYLPCLHIATK